MRYPALNSEVSALSGGFLVRMRSWFTPGIPAADHCAPSLRPIQALPLEDSILVSSSANSKACNTTCLDAAIGRGNVINFPLNGQAVLNQLAQELIASFAALGIDDHQPLEFQVIGGAQPRLRIDAGSYVEFRGSQMGYLAVIDGAFGVRMTVETTEPEDVLRLVRSYIVARLFEAARPGDQA